jgi:hypothetical protein
LQHVLWYQPKDKGAIKDWLWKRVIPETGMYVYKYVINTCNKCLVAISSFDGWLNNTQEASIENNFILIPEISINIYVYIYKDWLWKRVIPETGIFIYTYLCICIYKYIYIYTYI